MSVSASEEKTNYFIHKHLKDGYEAGLIELELDEGVEVVHMNLRGVGNYDHEVEMILINILEGNYDAEVVGIGEKYIKNEKYSTLREGRMVPTLRVHVKVKE